MALDPYNCDGHDGIVRDDGVILNDETIHYLCKQVRMSQRCLSRARVVCSGVLRACMCLGISV